MPSNIARLVLAGALLATVVGCAGAGGDSTTEPATCSSCGTDSITCTSTVQDCIADNGGTCSFGLGIATLELHQDSTFTETYTNGVEVVATVTGNWNPQPGPPETILLRAQDGSIWDLPTVYEDGAACTNGGAQ
jgi:hypothetical protein